MKERKWTARWKKLLAAGLTPSQLQAVHSLLDEVRAFGSGRMSESALNQLLQVVKEAK